MAYLKSDLEFLGVRVPVVRRVVRRHFEPGRTILVSAAEELWAHPVFEFRLAVVELLSVRPAQLEPRDLAMVERFVRAAKTWALVDPLATGVAAPLAEPEWLDRWALDPDFWVRRLALFSLLPALRVGNGDWERFTRYADSMLEDKEFFIRKAIGWILRDTSKNRPQLVRGWIEPRVSRASGVTLREAIKYL